MIRGHGLAALAMSVVAVLAGCGDSNDQGDKHVALGHVHGLGVNPADGTLYAASHHGLFRVSGNDAPEQIAGPTQDSWDSRSSARTISWPAATQARTTAGNRLISG